MNNTDKVIELLIKYDVSYNSTQFTVELEQLLTDQGGQGEVSAEVKHDINMIPDAETYNLAKNYGEKCKNEGTLNYVAYWHYLNGYQDALPPTASKSERRKEEILTGFLKWVDEKTTFFTDKDVTIGQIVTEYVINLSPDQSKSNNK